MISCVLLHSFERDSSEMSRLLRGEPELDVMVISSGEVRDAGVCCVGEAGQVHVGKWHYEWIDACDGRVVVSYEHALGETGRKCLLFGIQFGL